MDNNELATSVAQVVGQAIGEMSVGVAMSVLALIDAISKQPGVDRAQLYRDMLGALPEGEGVAYNAIDVIRTSLQKASGDGDPAG